MIASLLFFIYIFESFTTFFLKMVCTYWTCSHLHLKKYFHGLGALVGAVSKLTADQSKR